MQRILVIRPRGFLLEAPGAEEFQWLKGFKQGLGRCLFENPRKDADWQEKLNKPIEGAKALSFL